MIISFDILFLILTLLCAWGALWVKDLMSASMILGAYSFLLCLICAVQGAVDVAFTEATVGAGVSTVFFVATTLKTTRRSKD